jgi:alanine racemase
MFQINIKQLIKNIKQLIKINNTVVAYSIQHILSIINASVTRVTDASIEYLLIDSRKIVFPSSSLFFALHGPRRDGHQFIKEVYERGVRNFIVQKGFDSSLFSGANFLEVEDVLKALQTLAAHHRSHFDIPVIGITGSNGKTIVKEWLYQLLQEDDNIVRSPRSYNSQVGVPLSVWQIDGQHTLGIFEAGISTTGEMLPLEQIIRPTLGVLTNIGEAHSEGFKDQTEKINEKLKLFTHCNQLVYCKESLPTEYHNETVQLFTWSRKQEKATVFIKEETKFASGVSLTLVYQNTVYSIVVPFTDAASVDNAITCCCVLLLKGYNINTIANRLLHLQPVEMRLQLKKAVNNCYVLNDSYSNDISSFSIALDYLEQQSGDNTTTVILSDILQSGLDDTQLYQQVAIQLKQRNIHRLIGIGEKISRFHFLLSQAVRQTIFYPSTETFLEQTTSNQFRDEYILLKGARVFAFERISKWLEQKVHQTVLEINLSALAHNLKEYQKHLAPATKLMAMVKAFSYGSGSAEIARVLQFCKVDYLAVAYADEGVDLRKAGISLPIMVMNTDEVGFDILLEYNLEPVIYSFTIYHAFHHYLQQEGINQFPIHIKINTGMNRLGFEPQEAHELGILLRKQHSMAVKAVFSHLVGSESAEFDDFTHYQARLLNEACTELSSLLGYPFIKHIANSAAIFRHKDLQFDMVRLGIGLYGVDSAGGNQVSLETVATLQSTIAQIRTVKAGDTVSYNRKGKVSRDSQIATVRIGYADGYSRRLGNSVGSMYVHGQLAPVTGTICMDMTMIDITGIPDVKEGDIVEVFGKHLPVQQIAEWCGTIPYEIMTGIGQRVKRVYVEE